MAIHGSRFHHMSLEFRPEIISSPWMVRALSEYLGTWLLAGA